MLERFLFLLILVLFLLLHRGLTRLIILHFHGRLLPKFNIFFHWFLLFPLTLFRLLLRLLLLSKSSALVFRYSHYSMLWSLDTNMRCVLRLKITISLDLIQSRMELLRAIYFNNWFFLLLFVGEHYMFSSNHSNNIWAK